MRELPAGGEVSVESSGGARGRAAVVPFEIREK
jgi:hypothetical protein